MILHGIGRLPVVDDHQQLLGLITRQSLLEARKRQLDAERPPATLSMKVV